MTGIEELARAKAALAKALESGDEINIEYCRSWVNAVEYSVS